MSRLPTDLAKSHPLIICEGACEEVIVEKLLDEERLAFPSENVIDVTRMRGAAQIQENFLVYDVDEPACIIRLLDSLTERFVLGPLYRERFPVHDFHTRPEIEMLAILREGHYDQYAKRRKGKMKPSEYCMQILKLTEIKHRDFLEEYWDIASLVTAIREYKRVSKLSRGEHCLADLLKEAS